MLGRWNLGLVNVVNAQNTKVQNMILAENLFAF